MDPARDLRFIKLQSPLESLIWSLRMAHLNQKLPRSYKELKFDEPTLTEPQCHDDYYLALATWKSLPLFFASRGYTLYEKCETSDSVSPPPLPMQAENMSYPYSRMIARHIPPQCSWGPTTWPARDRLGREVMIKAISDASRPSDELKILQRLNEDGLRSHPFNHTIHALEFLTFDELVFVVMPRWDGAFSPDFATVSELMEITKCFLEVFVFLHQYRIVHHDFLERNTGMNCVMPNYYIHGHKGLRNPAKVRYTLFDFGYAVMYPEDCIIEDMVEDRRLYFGIRGGPPLKGSYNPFKADMALMGLELQSRVRHIENIVPELGPFFDRLVDPLDPTQFSASQALSRFMEIYNGLTGEQLEESVSTWLWKEGRLVKKYNYDELGLSLRKFDSRQRKPSIQQ